MLTYFDYSFGHEKLKKLIDFITVMPPLIRNHSHYRFPFTASEIFNCEINQLLDRFFNAPEELKKEAPASDEDEDDEKQPVIITIAIIDIYS